MADFRRFILAFAVVALLVGLVPMASAQVGVQCIANAAVPPTLRSEGLTELVGDIVLNCNGGTPTTAGQTIPQANITIFLNTQVTSRLLNSPQSEAVLTVDEPTALQTSAAQTCTSITGCIAIAAGPGAVNALEFKGFNAATGGACTVGTAGCTGNPNVFQGSVAGNSVQFVGIPIDPPGSQSTRIYRITNVRANATIPAPGGSGTPGQIIALISATPATSGQTGQSSTFAINNPTQIVGFVQTSLQTTVTAFASASTALNASTLQLQQCVGAGVSGGKTGTFATLNYIELFPTAFKTRTIAGAGFASPQDTLGLVYNSETGYYNPRLAVPLGGGGVVASGLADYGTRLKAVFNNIPNGISIFVSVNNTINQTATTSPTTGTFATLTSSETGGFSPVSPTSTTTIASPAINVGGTIGGVFQIPIVNGTGSAVWEVLAANPLASQTFSFGYYVIASPSPSTNSPAVGTGTVNMSYAPVPPVAFTAAAGGVASATLTIPRFIDTSVATNIVSVVLCRTNLLYPFVTNQAGFDTGLAISNTSTDPFGTAAQQGPCTLNFFGANAPAAVTSPSVASGTAYTTLASLVAPNFQGYVIAVCNFQYAHGFAFISDVGARNLAMGYLALIIPDPPRSAQPFECANSGIVGCVTSGEQLGY